MQRDYAELMDLAIERAAFQGFLTTEEKTRQAKVEGRFNAARNRFVYDLLKTGESADTLSASVAAELDEIARLDPGYAPVVEDVKYELLARIESDGKRSPAMRRVIRWTPVAIGIVLVVAYFGVRFYSAVPIAHPIDTRAGIEERAAALHKTIRYNEWVGTRVRRGGLFKGLLLWPIEPTEAEFAGAREFAAVTVDAYQALTGEGMICDAQPIVPRADLDDAHIAMIEVVADHVRQQGITWRTPPIMTVLDPIRERYPCNAPPR